MRSRTTIDHPLAGGRGLLLLLPALVLSVSPGCSTGPGEPIDLLRVVSPTSLKVKGRALPPIWVKLEGDKRPHRERGERKYLGTSHLRDSALVEPTDVVLLRSLARDLVLAGVAEGASIRDKEQPYALGVTINSCRARFGEGLANLLLILPTSGIEAVCSFQISLKDRDGRVFLERAFEGTSSGSAAPVSGLETAAARALAKAIRAAVDQALDPVHRAPAAFWAKYRKTLQDERP